MSKSVKPQRTYRSERRRQQAAQTRERVLEAACALFVERGFDGASIAAIADRAGVAAETVYATFANKRTLLGELVRQAVRGEDPSPVVEQPGPLRVAAAADQREQLRLFAVDVVERLERVGPLITVLTGAALANPELAQLLAGLHEERLRNLGTLVDALAATGPIKGGHDSAAETVWVLASPELHELLSRTRGWTRERYTAWLADSLAALLL